MKTTIEQRSNTGRFAYLLTAEIGADVDAPTKVLTISGLANEGFRASGSAIDRALIAAGLATKETKRADVEYSKESAAVVQKAAQAALDKLTKEDGYPEMIFEVTGEHVYGEGQNVLTKEATTLFENIVKGLREHDKTLTPGAAEAAVIGKLGATDRDAAILVCKGKLQAMKKAAAEKTKADLMAAMEE